MSPLLISKNAMHGTNTNIGHEQYKKKLLFSLDTGISTASPAGCTANYMRFKKNETCNKISFDVGGIDLVAIGSLSQWQLL